MSTPKPFVSNEQMKVTGIWGTKSWSPGLTLDQLRDIYEAHVQQLVRERDDLRDALDLMRQFSKMNHVEEVIYDDSGECRITKFTLHEMVDELLNTPPSNG